MFLILTVSGITTRFKKERRATATAVQRKNILLSPIRSKINNCFLQSSLTTGFECREESLISTIPAVSQHGTSVPRYKPIRVVFDLDCVLVSDICPVDSKIRDFDKIRENIGHESIIESCGYYFYLYNGWKELIKYVMELSDNQLIFFSSGARERNEDIIPKMLERVLGRDPMEYVRNNVKIFSRHHTIDTSRMPTEESDKYQPAGMWGNSKKDLTVAVSAEELKYTVLIDDDETYIVPGQEKNLLRIDGRTVVDDLRKCVKASRDEDIALKEVSLDQRSFLPLNKLFYAAGVLRDVCDTYSRVDRDLVDIMWDNHGFKVRLTDDGYEEPYELLRRFEVYQSGLDVLREIDSNVCFLVTKKF